MGVTRFLVSSPDVLPPPAIERIYFTGLDGIPAATTARWDQGIEVDRDVSDSGNYHVPWQITGMGEVMLSTASLPERDRPYRLAVELAPGSLSQLRNQAGEWQEIGLVLPESFSSRLRAATRMFGETLTTSTDLRDTEQRSAEILRLVLE